jgi:uncharacterized protein
MPLSLEDGKASVSLARESIEASVVGKVPARASQGGVFAERRGVFVTLNSTPVRPDSLRGCIGFPFPVKPLRDAIVEAAVAASSEDPRFPPLRAEELGSVVVEVSVLTVPQLLKAAPTALPSKIRIGVDGLIISRGYQSGLLLPQVATEFGMDQTEFLSQACMKAGLPPDSWLDAGTQVQVFQAEIFAEEKPRGNVVKVNPRES